MADSFTTFKIGEDITKMYLNLELRSNNDIITHPNDRRNFGRIIFYPENVDELYSQFKSDACTSELISFENEPTDALWGERYFHIRDPDGYQLSFAMPVRKKGKLTLLVIFILPFFYVLVFNFFYNTSYQVISDAIMSSIAIISRICLTLIQHIHRSLVTPLIGTVDIKTD